jgi:hypothetical protein
LEGGIGLVLEGVLLVVVGDQHLAPDCHPCLYPCRWEVGLSLSLYRQEIGLCPPFPGAQPLSLPRPGGAVRTVAPAVRAPTNAVCRGPCSSKRRTSLCWSQHPSWPVGELFVITLSRTNQAKAVPPGNVLVSAMSALVPIAKSFCSSGQVEQTCSFWD